MDYSCHIFAAGIITGIGVQFYAWLNTEFIEYSLEDVERGFFEIQYHASVISMMVYGQSGKAAYSKHYGNA